MSASSSGSSGSIASGEIVIHGDHSAAGRRLDGLVGELLLGLLHLSLELLHLLQHLVHVHGHVGFPPLSAL
jgi:hypothetical protein